MADPAFHTPLVHEGILAVRGPDAAKFLQGQLTCNLAYLNDETSSLGGRCNIKGRLLSSFRILPEGDGLLLAMAGELLEAQLADLKKYAVFSKASLADESAAWLRIGLRDASEALRALGIDTPAESGRIARHGDLLAVALGDAQGLVNTTPVGMAKLPGMPVPAELLRADLWVAEVIYFPLETELLRQARALGCRTLDGGTMAVFQAVKAFELFSGVAADAARMQAHFASLGD